MARSTRELRELWHAYECAPAKMATVPFGPDRIRIAPQTAGAWAALAAVLAHHGYRIRPGDTDSYNCRAIKGGGARSLHAFGIALDVNWATNPYRDHDGERAVRWSAEADQAARAEQVRLGRADTDFTPALIADVARIATVAGERVFEWGGSWRTIKDPMHFEIDLSPAELACGIDPATVAGGGLRQSAPAGGWRVAARAGLHLRAGPGTQFGVLRTCPAGTPLAVLGRRGAWAEVDLAGDGLADGYMSLAFLRELDPPRAGEDYLQVNEPGWLGSPPP